MEIYRQAGMMILSNTSNLRLLSLILFRFANILHVAYSLFHQITNLLFLLGLWVNSKDILSYDVVLIWLQLLYFFSKRIKFSFCFQVVLLRFVVEYFVVCYFVILLRVKPSCSKPMICIGHCSYSR